MTDSVYAAIFRKRIDTVASILFLKRSNGQWWLPGGIIEAQDKSPSQAIQRHVPKLLVNAGPTPGRIGWWRLSPEAGGYLVHLFEGYLPEPDKLRVRGAESGLSEELAFFSHHQIREHLYEDRDMPWGQAKMALYCLHDLYKGDQRAEGEQLKDDLGELDGVVWNRPE